ncbi:HPP family protein [Algoriphagus sp. NG3]|uniref:HPP family protein n=1 Tax=unclassified Algoriphagus TaxID=2641541 RepID=UPI002A826B2C|nr:HPP family protein [Algoriphagus sp. NG3]WPR76379.1 HPP family protein [Algoriphagus sp. NG3]
MKKQIQRGIRVSRYVFYKETLIDAKEHFWSFVGAFVGIGLITYFHSSSLSNHENLFLIGSFGASSVLVYGLIGSPLAQPRNLVGGHVVSALVGVTVNLLLPDTLWLAAPLAVALSIVLMQMTRTLHPPGGATALIAVIGSEKVKALGYMYVLSPVLTGSLILLLVALIFNNMTSNRKYPSDRQFSRTVKMIRKKSFVRKRNTAE